MITFTKAFLTSDERTFSTVEEAQRHEIALLLRFDESDLENAPILNSIMDSAEKIVDILTTTVSSKPKARKCNGGKKTRKPTTEPTAATTTPALAQ